MNRILLLFCVIAFVITSCGGAATTIQQVEVATYTVTAISIATQIPTVPATATPDCSTLVRTWNQKFAPVFAALINTNDAFPKAELLVFTDARDRLLEFNPPLCDVDSMFVHAHTLEAVHRYIDWIDAVLAGDDTEANKQEAEGDGLFGPAADSYVGNLLKANDESSIQMIFGKTIAELRLANAVAAATAVPVVATALPPTATQPEPTTEPTQPPPTAVPTKRPATAVPTKRPPTAIPTKAVDACKPQLARFVSSVSKMVSVSSSLLNNMSSYADYGSKTSFSSSFVERTFSGLNGISVPTCADQPTEIVYSLGLIRDTMFPAYIEMEMGGGSSASRADVGRWRDEVNGLLNDVERLMGQID